MRWGKKHSVHDRNGLSAGKKSVKPSRPESTNKLWTNVRNIPVRRIQIPSIRRKLQPEKVEEIAKSFSIVGQICPIVIRRAVFGRKKKKIVLISGMHRLAAAKKLGWNKIRAIQFTGSKVDARLCEAAEDLHRAHLTVLEHDEKLGYWLSTLAARQSFRQKVEKGGLGRPRKPAFAARDLPIAGKTANARQKMAERALKIFNISPEAKEAIRKAEMDNSRAKMLEVAQETSVRAQIAKVKEITDRRSVTRPQPQKQGTAVSPNKLSPEHNAMYGSMKLAWKRAKSLRILWRSAPFEVRTCFISRLQAMKISDKQ